ncbi:bacteriorhodopsin [Halorientalis pallida]|uniref:Rhodopsin n=1 Tax=Halorientalis pallida TaxID=2479928 RepID=A0A498L739_9EURY|nr:bacteriorhodopsin [Halorientalis pallida]RXK51545.1 rhodopsin [Halorientalis pallida]
MISSATVYAASAGVYAAVVAALVLWLRRIPESYRQYCYPVLGIVVISGIAVALDAARIGTIVVNEYPITIPSLLGDLIAYPALWAVAALLAGVDRRMLGITVAIPFVQRGAFTVAAVTDGLVALVSVSVVVGGHLVLLYLYRNQIWEAAQSVSDGQRLLHWKGRNLLLFLIGMIIVSAVLGLTGLFDTFVSAVLTQYMNLLIRAGFAGFLFANVTNIDVGDAGGNLLEEIGGSGNQPADPNPAD